MKLNEKGALASLCVLGSLVFAAPALANPGAGHHEGPFHVVMLDILSGIDTNADAALSQEEINAAIGARYTAFDGNKDGRLSLEEFQALWVDLTQPVAVRAFQFLDPDGDAAVARAEVDKRFSSLVARLDRNDDGKLSHADRPRSRRGHGWHDWNADNPQQ